MPGLQAPGIQGTTGRVTEQPAAPSAIKREKVTWPGLRDAAGTRQDSNSSLDRSAAMKSTAFLLALLTLSTAAVAQQTPDPAAPPKPAATSSAQDLLALCPPDMPPACACVAQGKGVRVMPANEAYKSRLKVLLVGPKK